MSHSFNPYTAPRSTTPPLYYRRPDGVPQSYYAVPQQREVASLAIPGYPTPRSSTSRPEERPYPVAPAPSAIGAAGGASLVPPSPSAYARPSPATAAYGSFVAGALPHDHRRPSISGGMYGAPDPAASFGGLWSYQQPPPRQDDDVRRLAQLEAEEAALAAEEATLTAAKAELLATRRRQEGEQQQLSEGWAALLEREERYYTEPVPDYSQEIAARAQQCATLEEQLRQAESHRGYLQQQLENYDYVVRDKEAAEAEIARVREGLQVVEQRRRACIARAERFFDVETKRVIEAKKAVRKLDVVLHDMTASGPLAQLQQANGSNSRSQSRCVSFAPAEKSIVIDIGRRNESLSTSVSMDRTRADTQGLSQGNDDDEEESGSFGSRRLNLSKPGAKAVGGNIGGASVCFGVGDDEEDMGIGGTSVAFSLNNSTSDAISKRRKIELIA